MTQSNTQSLQNVLRAKLGLPTETPASQYVAPVATNSLKAVQMPGRVYELTRDFAGTVGMPHEVLMDTLFARMGLAIEEAMAAVVASHNADEALHKAKAQRETSQYVARMHVDTLLGVGNPVSVTL